MNVKDKGLEKILDKYLDKEDNLLNSDEGMGWSENRKLWRNALKEARDYGQTMLNTGPKIDLSIYEPDVVASLYGYSRKEKPKKPSRWQRLNPFNKSVHGKEGGVVDHKSILENEFGWSKDEINNLPDKIRLELEKEVVGKEKEE